MRTTSGTLRFALALALVAACVLPASGEAGKSRDPKGPGTHHSPVIRPAPDAPWDASVRDVEKVLDSAAEQLWAHFPNRTIEPILVEPKGGPIVLYQRGTNGEYQVRLNTGKTYWAQYAFQFGHEFCHILCGYVEDDPSNKWFEESLCETASLFALRGMARAWQTQPPYRNWRDFARHLRTYADTRLSEVHLPEGTSLAEWYKRHEAELRKEPCHRDRNRVVASVLLPLLEEQPAHWEAVTWLNASPSKEERTFRQFLGDWQRKCPAKHRGFVRRVAAEFGILLSAHADGATPAAAPEPARRTPTD